MIASRALPFTTWYCRSSTKVLLAVLARGKRTSCGDALASGNQEPRDGDSQPCDATNLAAVERLLAAWEWERVRTNTSYCVVMLSGEAADMVLLNIGSSCCRRIERTDEDSWNPSLRAIFA
jgi:hypothetical protein